jgi:hypothetical protein
MHLVLHIAQVLAWFPLSLMCLSDNCATSSEMFGVGFQWNVLFLLVKCSCQRPRAVFPAQFSCQVSPSHIVFRLFHERLEILQGLRCVSVLLRFVSG